MELKKVYEAMERFDNVKKSEADKFQQTKKQLREDYGNGKLFDAKFAEARAAYTAAVEAAKNSGIEAVEQAFADLNKRIQDMITAPVPSDFSATLEAIKATGGNLSEDEAMLYISKYSGNYTAYRTVVSLMDTFGVCKVYPVTYTAVKEDCDRAYAMAIGFFKNTIGGYMTALLLADSNPVKAFDNSISLFLNGNILDYGKAVQDDSGES